MYYIFQQKEYLDYLYIFAIHTQQFEITFAVQ